MANFSNIARPYALAAFEYAHEKQQLVAWTVFLKEATYITEQSSVTPLLVNPQVLPAQLFDLYQSAFAHPLSVEQQNFLHLLVQNKRLNILPKIMAAFNAYCAQLEKISHVRVVTATTPKEEFKQKLIQALAKRINSHVTLQCDIDPAILGGAIIHMGDNVIDGSIRGKLTRLLEFSLR
jgi:F-type H+-transporting ATPase subunit delta